ncbi:uncharacterized protein LOC134338728 [Mobula hypostoma]|uniref:uncharacterized protein LOC134338728 n=1 Tax=Mobula hypostoma TaxID=723540 RepID=UPI002FC38716
MVDAAFPQQQGSLHCFCAGFPGQWPRVRIRPAPCTLSTRAGLSVELATRPRKTDNSVKGTAKLLPDALHGAERKGNKVVKEHSGSFCEPRARELTAHSRRWKKHTINSLQGLTKASLIHGRDVKGGNFCHGAPATQPYERGGWDPVRVRDLRLHPNLALHGRWVLTLRKSSSGLRIGISKSGLEEVCPRGVASQETETSRPRMWLSEASVL